MEDQIVQGDRLVLYDLFDRSQDIARLGPIVADVLPGVEALYRAAYANTDALRSYISKHGDDAITLSASHLRTLFYGPV